jgi:hypothetical protein
MRETTPGLSSMGVGSHWSPCSIRSEPLSVLRVRADSGGRLFTAKLRVVVQLLDELLVDEPILLACQFCDCLCDRGTRCSAQKRDLGVPSLALSDGCRRFLRFTVKRA